MATAPYGIRLLVGVAATAVEETMRLPQTILTYPMTIASQVAQLVMKMQQDVADLVIKGDATLETLFPPRDEQPEWATFDEDVADEIPDSSERMTEGRFALYSVTEDTEGRVTETATPAAKAANVAAAGPATGVVGDIDYDGLTLAQLRARLQSLSVSDLEELLGYEEATKARAPFQTLLANRITRATAR
jgi:hypothetical protein